MLRNSSESLLCFLFFNSLIDLFALLCVLLDSFAPAFSLGASLKGILLLLLLADARTPLLTYLLERESDLDLCDV